MKLSLPFPKEIKPIKTLRPLNNKGYVLPLVLLVTLVCFSLGGAILVNMNFSLRESNEYLNYQKMILFGKNELERLHADMANDPKAYYSSPNQYTTTRTNDEEYYCELKYRKTNNNMAVYWLWITAYGNRRRYRIEASFSPDGNTLTDFSAHIWSKKDDIEHGNE